LSVAFATDAHKQAQWKAFLRKNRLPALGLPEVVERLEAALCMVWMQTNDAQPAQAVNPSAG
jgi:hypothetical protein